MQIDRDFEKYLGGPTQSPFERVHVTINAQNVIGINENLYRMLGLRVAVNLFFSRTKDEIAIEPLHTTRFSTAFPVRRKTHCGWRINASPFCKHFGIRIDTTERFLSPEIKDNQLHLKLSETVTVRQIRRKKKG